MTIGILADYLAGATGFFNCSLSCFGKFSCLYGELNLQFTRAQHFKSGRALNFLCKVVFGDVIEIDYGACRNGGKLA